ncbi:MAG: DUF3078 domain-containing protein [Bacteroidia bacterium]|nr:DUF3078 domain-containing protein [Bacteroidia bacterium]
MMKKIAASLHFLIITFVCCAQSDTMPKPKWTHALQTGINLNQASFSDNWKGGGVSSYAMGAFLNYLAKFQGTKWDNNSDLQLQLGYLQNKGEVQRKNADRIFYDYKAGYRLAAKWNVFASLNFMSQFKEGFDYKTKSVVDLKQDSLISNFLAPAYLTSSLGLEYKPVVYLWMRFGLGTLRQTIINDTRISNAKLYGLEKAGDKLRNQVVFQYIISFDKEIVKNVTLKWRYTVNFDYYKVGKPNAFVHILNANLTLKATKYISTNVSVNLIRDNDQDKALQLSQVLSLGVLYSFEK